MLTPEYISVTEQRSETKSKDELFDDGVANAGSIFKRGEEVVRPCGPHSPGVHALLQHLSDQGFHGAPLPIALEPQTERLSYIHGTVPKPPYDDWFLQDEVLIEVARLLRRFHEAVKSFTPPSYSQWNTGLSDPRGKGIICHNDVIPGNVVFDSGKPVGFIDFDFAAPGSHLWDVARSARAWVPLDSPESTESYGLGGLNHFTRLRTFVDGYELCKREREEIAGMLEECNTVSETYVTSQMRAGKPSFVALWKKYDLDTLYEKRRNWFRTEREKLAAALA